MQTLKIGELATRSGCHVETIRFYEKKGLLPASLRSPGNFRLYTDVHVDRLVFIRYCRSIDISLKEIGKFLLHQDFPVKNDEYVSQLLDLHLRRITVRVQELNAFEQELVELQRCRKRRHREKQDKNQHV